ncbi:hypothetical protein M4I21_11125 [Cellulophaga sp. 20_2_10]|uniref:hypothetical protein n=1 Tax=Cellulophaga sp. 20_2_10 TaxID=2942476 RepID=UPI00201AE177|nr:hypothetical protein [Cellulophaga sp. 20_2_10]MCL5246364.1 hypothetical protein [Cellulophaga sp. 20_2_10]
MQKRILSLFFTILLTGFIITPAVLLTVDDSIDITIFYNAGEEEENVNVLNLEDFNIAKKVELAFFKPKKDLYTPMYYFKNYQKPQLILLVPPPEVN